MKVILSIVDKFLTKLQAQLDARNVELIYSKKVLNWIAENGYNKEMGARPMERFITNKIKKPLVDKVLFGELSKGGQIKVDLVANEVKFSAKKKTAKSKSLAASKSNSSFCKIIRGHFNFNSITS